MFTTTIQLRFDARSTVYQRALSALWRNPLAVSGFHKQRNARVLFVALHVRNATQKYAIPGYRHGNKCAKNCCKRTIQIQLIVEDVVKCYFGPQCRPICCWSAQKVTVYLALPSISSATFFHALLFTFKSFNSFFLFHKHGYLCTTLNKTSSKNFTFAADAMVLVSIVWSRDEVISDVIGQTLHWLHKN